MDIHNEENKQTYTKWYRLLKWLVATEQTVIGFVPTARPILLAIDNKKYKNDEIWFVYTEQKDLFLDAKKDKKMCQLQIYPPWKQKVLTRSNIHPFTIHNSDIRLFPQSLTQGLEILLVSHCWWVRERKWLWN